jgi:predicted Zn-dependent peptidase
VSEYFKAVLGNGVTLVAERHTQVCSASVGVWVKVGSSYEKSSISGVSHFIEHMVFKGTKTRTPFEIATLLESLGGDLNAFTDREFTCFHATVLSQHIDVALDVISDLLIHPTFPKDELERERKVLLQEMSMVEEAPDDYIGDVFFDAVWKTDPLGPPVIGNKKTVKSMTRAQLTKFFGEHYRAENIVVSIAGNFEFDALKATVVRLFGEMPSAKKKTFVPKSSRYLARHRALGFNTDQLHLLLGYEGVGFKDPFRFDALILSFFLGGGMSSRLFQEIREKAGLAYTVDCNCIPFMETGVFSIYVALNGRSLAKCMDILGREIRLLKEKPITDLQLDMVKGQLKGSILLSSDQMETRQESLGRNEIVFGRYISVEEIIEEIERVSPERIQEIANRMFTSEKQSSVTLGKIKPKAADLAIL